MLFFWAKIRPDGHPAALQGPVVAPISSPIRAGTGGGWRVREARAARHLRSMTPLSLTGTVNV